MVDQIGKHSYGIENIQVLRWDSAFNPHCQVTIGNFCSIANNLKIITNGNHKYLRPTTYPFAELGWTPITISNSSAYGNGNIIIGNDIWIGANCTIISNVKIGDGAIIAANSIVVKDVEPYSIVGGNPAKLIKFRFNKDTIDKMLQIKWWDWEIEKIKQAIPLLTTDDECKEFIKKYFN